MLRVVGIFLALTCIAVAIYTTIAQIQPALYFIELTTVDGKFPATAVILITALSLLLPLIAVLFIIGKFSGNKDFMPDLTGRTGIVVKRPKALYGAAYVNKIFVDGELKSAVSNGKSTFIPLAIGTYLLQVKSKKLDGITISIKGNTITTVEFTHVDEGLKAKLKLKVID